MDSGETRNLSVYLGALQEVLRTIEVNGRGAEKHPVIPAGGTILQPTEMRFKDFLNQLRKDQAAHAKQVMEHLPEKPTGIVITGLTHGSDDDYYGHYSTAESARTPEGTAA